MPKIEKRIISASRRTDIPALYSEWFMNRIRQKYVSVQNPVTLEYFKVDLSPDKVAVIVFWTKNPEPMLKHLDELNDRGYKYYFTFTLNAYPQDLEPSIPPFAKIIDTFKALSNKIGADKVIWRFDPIIISTITRESDIINRFETIAKELHGYTQRVVISFVDFNPNFIDNIKKLRMSKRIYFNNVSKDIECMERISTSLAGIAKKYSMEIFSCAEKHDLSHCEIKRGKCIDDELIRKVFGINLNLKKTQPLREFCGCAKNTDIGQYDSCINECIYCYATRDKNVARFNFSSHDPYYQTLISPPLV